MNPRSDIRLLSGAFGVCLLLSVNSCDSDDILDPERSGDAVATMVTPAGDVAGAVLELTGVTAVILDDGDVLTREDGERLRVVILLDKPGVLDFGVTLDQVAEPVGVVLDVIDSEDRAVESLTGYRLEFAR